MRIPTRLIAPLLVLLPLTALPAQEGLAPRPAPSPSPAAPGGGMFPIGCNLGCSSGAGGAQVTCSTTEIHVNEELRVRFSQPIAPTSLSVASFRLFDVANGSSPVGGLFVDPADPAELVFRPALSIDANLRPVFGFHSGSVYQMFVPGIAQGDSPPYVLSTDGTPNQSRVHCSFVASLGVRDYVPGAPLAEVFVDRIDPVTGRVELGVPAAGATSVLRRAPISIRFKDLIDPSTLFQVPSLTLTGVSVEISDQGGLPVPVPGFALFGLDIVGATSTLTFVPTPPLPASGPSLPTRVIVRLEDGILDVAGNELVPFSLSFLVQEPAPKIAPSPLRPVSGGARRR